MDSYRILFFIMLCCIVFIDCTVGHVLPRAYVFAYLSVQAFWCIVCYLCSLCYVTVLCSVCFGVGVGKESGHASLMPGIIIISLL